MVVACARNLSTAHLALQVGEPAEGAAGELRAADGVAVAGDVAGERFRVVALWLRTVDGRAGRAVNRCVARRVRRVWSVCVAWSFFCAVCCGRLHRALRQDNKLTALPESFGQLTALQTLELSRASACAELRCCCGPWTVEEGER